MLLLMENGSFTQNGFSCFNNEVVNLMLVCKICSQTSYKDYADNTLNNIENNSSNISIVNTNLPLGHSQPFAVSFFKADDDIIIDMV